MDMTNTSLTPKDNTNSIILNPDFDAAFSRLTPKQQVFISRRAEFYSDYACSQAVGVDCSNIYTWKEQPDFGFCYSLILNYIQSRLRDNLLALPLAVTDAFPVVLQEERKRYTEDKERDVHGVARLLEIGLKPVLAQIRRGDIIVNVTNEFPVDLINEERAKRGLGKLERQKEGASQV
jgi:hypothetical protein